MADIKYSTAIAAKANSATFFKNRGLLKTDIDIYVILRPAHLLEPLPNVEYKIFYFDFGLFAKIFFCQNGIFSQNYYVFLKPNSIEQ